MKLREREREKTTYDKVAFPFSTHLCCSNYKFATSLVPKKTKNDRTNRTISHYTRREARILTLKFIYANCAHSHHSVNNWLSTMKSVRVFLATWRQLVCVQYYSVSQQMNIKCHPHFSSAFYSIHSGDAHTHNSLDSKRKSTLTDECVVQALKTNLNHNFCEAHSVVFSSSKRSYFFLLLVKTTTYTLHMPLKTKKKKREKKLVGLFENSIVAVCRCCCHCY